MSRYDSNPPTHKHELPSLPKIDKIGVHLCHQQHYSKRNLWLLQRKDSMWDRGFGIKELDRIYPLYTN